MGKCSKNYYVAEFRALTLEAEKIKRIGVLADTYVEAIRKATIKCPNDCPWVCTDCTELSVYMYHPLE